MKEMTEEPIYDLLAERIGGKQFGSENNLYKFEKIRRAKKKALLLYPKRPLLDFGVGEPDRRPSDELCKVLYDWSLKLSKHGYTENGKEDYKNAVSRYMEKQFSVKGLDPERHILPTIGTKEALANIPKALIDPGDIVLMPTPGYPILATNARFLGGKIHYLPLLAKNDFFPDLDHIPCDILDHAKILYLNYPNNPIGKCATEEFYNRAIRFAKKHTIAIVQDAPYISIVYDRKPLSILSIPGAMDVAIEMHSFSKSFSMAGWRIGFCAGNELLIKALGFIKDNTDSGSFEAIQKTAIYAMDHAERFQRVNQAYERRLRMLVSTLSTAGLDVRMPEGTFYLYLNMPKTMTISGKTKIFTSAEEFTRTMIEEHGIVTVPWDENGEHYIRFSATFTAPDEQSEKEVMDELSQRLEGITFS